MSHYCLTCCCSLEKWDPTLTPEYLQAFFWQSVSTGLSQRKHTHGLEGKRGICCLPSRRAQGPKTEICGQVREGRAEAFPLWNSCAPTVSPLGLGSLLSVYYHHTVGPLLNLKKENLSDKWSHPRSAHSDTQPLQVQWGSYILRAMWPSPPLHVTTYSWGHDSPSHCVPFASW